MTSLLFNLKKDHMELDFCFRKDVELSWNGAINHYYCQVKLLKYKSDDKDIDINSRKMWDYAIYEFKVQELKSAGALDASKTDHW